MAGVASFDLVSQPWIPVVRSGAEELVSLRACVAEAHQIDGLSTTDGPRLAGLLRMLVALVMDVYGQPTNDRDWAARRERGCFDAAVFDHYVAAVGRSRFDLFDAAYPFMQSAALADAGKSIAELLPHVSTGNRTPIFTPDTDSSPRRLSFAQAAQALVAAQAVAVPAPGAPKGDDPKQSWVGSSFAGRAAIIGFCCPLGDNLFETLMMNVPSSFNSPHKPLDGTDLPAWRRDDVPPTRRKRFAGGMVDLLTWTPRRVRLIPDGDTVSRVAFRGGDGLPKMELLHEPHTALRRSDGKGPGALPAGEWYARKHLRYTIGWRGIPQLLALGEHHKDSQPPIVLRELGNRLELLPPDYRVTVLSMYVEYGTMNAVFDDITTDMFSLPIRAFGEAEVDVRDMLVNLVQTADEVRSLVRGYAADVYAVTRRDLEKERRASKAFAAEIESMLVSRIDVITRRLLSKLAADPDAMDALRANWNTQLRGVADGMVASINTDCGPDVFALIASTNSTGRRAVTVRPPAIRQAQLRAELARLVGADYEESTV